MGVVDFVAAARAKKKGQREAWPSLRRAAGGGYSFAGLAGEAGDAGDAAA